MRTPERFRTGIGRLRLGGCGAAGAPQPVVVYAAESARAKTSSLRFMLSQRKSLFGRCESRLKSGSNLRIFEVEAGGTQAGRHNPLAFEQDGLRHFTKRQSEPKGGDAQQGGPVQDMAEYACEL